MTLVSSRVEFHPIVIFPALHSSKGSPSERETFEGGQQCPRVSSFLPPPRHRLFSTLLSHPPCTTRQIYEQREYTYFTGHNSEKKRMRSRRVAPAFYNGDGKKWITPRLSFTLESLFISFLAYRPG